MKVEEIEKKVLNYIKKNGLIETRERILVAVSGGPDSIFLLHLLNLYKSALKIELVCCHINHKLREEASERDEKFVKDFSQKMDIPFVAKSVNVSSYKKDQHLSLEDAARRLRLKRLEKAAEETESQKIALGHTADDSIETFFLNLLRGAGRRGLLGIQPMRGKFIHPLLCLSKREILIYLKEKNIDYRIDVTNWNRQYRRNFIRRELVPLIEERLNRGVKTNISQLIEVLRDEEEILSKEVEKVVKKIFRETEEGLLIERETFRRLKPGIQRRLIMRCFEGMTESEAVRGKPRGIKAESSEAIAIPPRGKPRGFLAKEGDARLNFKEIESLRTAISGKSSGLRFSYYGTTFFVGSDAVLVQNKNITSEDNKKEKVFLDIPGKVLFQNRYYITASVLKSLNGDIDNPNCAYFDLETIHPPLVLRTRANGDKFRPFGMNQEKKVKNFLIDKKIPFWERDKIPLIEDSEGILWIVGLRRAEIARVREKTKRILKLEKREIG